MSPDPRDGARPGQDGANDDEASGSGEPLLSVSTGKLCCIGQADNIARMQLTHDCGVLMGGTEVSPGPAYDSARALHTDHTTSYTVKHEHPFGKKKEGAYALPRKGAKISRLTIRNPSFLIKELIATWLLFALERPTTILSLPTTPLLNPKSPSIAITLPLFKLLPLFVTDVIP